LKAISRAVSDLSGKPFTNDRSSAKGKKGAAPASGKLELLMGPPGHGQHRQTAHDSVSHLMGGKHSRSGLPRQRPNHPTVILLNARRRPTSWRKEPLKKAIRGRRSYGWQANNSLAWSRH